VLERALRLCGTVRAVALRFARLRVDGRVVDWEFGDAAGAVAEVGRICEREGLAFRMRPEDALRGCPETDLPPIVLSRAGLAALRDAVRAMAAAHPLVRSARPGERGEGGDGATVVTF